MSEDNTLFFWLGDGNAFETTKQGFEGMQKISADNDRRWKDVDTTKKSYYFYGIIEEIDDEPECESDDYEDNSGTSRFDGLFDD